MPSQTLTDTRPTFAIEPCRDDAELRSYIDTYWRPGHVLARDERMFEFTYRTPWVDREVFTTGTSVLGVYDDEAVHGEAGRLLGFLGTIVAPFPRPRSCWLALWHVLPELKGTGMGGALLKQMQEIALAPGAKGPGWIGTFGAGPEALPVYLKRGYAVRAVRRWVYDVDKAGNSPRAASACTLHGAEREAPTDWLDYRFGSHPIYEYDVREDGNVFRTETNTWGVVTHCCRLTPNWANHVPEVADRTIRHAQSLGFESIIDAWSFDCPGEGWTLAPDDLPSVFHPPEARGNTIYAVGRPFVPTTVHKGDCDQDRPN